MKLTISEAARRAGVKRQALYRKLESGKLSKEMDDSGNPVIDLSELARIYPNAATYAGQADSTATHKNGHNVTDIGQYENAFLRERIASLEADKADLRRDLERERADRERLLALIERNTETVKQLTDQRTPPPIIEKRGFWPFKRK